MTTINPGLYCLEDEDDDQFFAYRNANGVFVRIDEVSALQIVCDLAREAVYKKTSIKEQDRFELAFEKILDFASDLIQEGFDSFERSYAAKSWSEEVFAYKKNGQINLMNAIKLCLHYAQSIKIDEPFEGYSIEYLSQLHDSSIDILRDFIALNEQRAMNFFVTEEDDDEDEGVFYVTLN